MTMSALKKLKIECRPDLTDETLVGAVKLPFTPKQWLGLLDREGEYLQSCCANISDARDVFFDAIRESGWLDRDKLAKVVDLLSTHDFFSDFFKDKEARSVQREKGHPAAVLFDIWDAARDVMRDRRTKINTLDVSDWRDAATLVARGIPVLRWEMILSHQTPSDKFHGDLAKLSLMKDLVPGISTLYAKVKELVPDPVEGFALMNKTTKKLAYGNRGLFAFFDVASVEVELKRLLREDPTLWIDFQVQKVRFSMEQGVEILP